MAVACAIVPLGRVAAQTARWAVKPVYTSLVRYDERTFKIYSTNKVGLIDVQGNEVLPAAFDSLTNASGGYALALKSVSGKYQIKAVIQTDTYAQTEVTGTYFLTKYSQFREGMLCVTDAQGRWGFLGTDGKLAIGCDYQATHPFCEGWASVTTKDKMVLYINAQGQALRGMEAGNGLIYFGSSFKDGTALVYARSATGFKGYLINRVGRIVNPYNVPLKNVQVDPQDYTLFQAGSASATEEAETEYDGPTPFAEGDLWGYKQGNAVVLPAQFQEAEPFAQGYARVRWRGRYGILRLVNGAFTGHAQSQTQLKVTDKAPEPFKYVMQGPVNWASGMFVLTFVNPETGIQEKASHEADGTFTLVPNVEQKQPSAAYELALYADDLKVWSGTQELAFSYGPTLTIGADIRESYKANEFDVCAGPTVTIKNNTATEQTVHVYIAGGPLKTVDTSVTVPGNSSKTVTSTAPSVVKKVAAAVTVKVGEAFRQTKNVTFNTFF